MQLPPKPPKHDLGTQLAVMSAHAWANLRIPVVYEMSVALSAARLLQGAHFPKPSRQATTRLCCSPLAYLAEASR
jgi:hypothetical protein